MSLKNAPPQIAIFFLLSCVALFWTLSQNYGEFSFEELFVFGGYALLIIIGQLGFISLLTLGAKKCACLSDLAKFAATIFTALNIFTLILVHNVGFAVMTADKRIAVVCGIGVLVSLFYFIRDERFQKFAKTFSIVMMVFMAIQVFNGSVSSDSFKSVPAHFSTPDFVKKPNIYVISLDAISPEAVLKQNLKISGIKYDEETIKSGGRIIPNAFAERIPTKNSLNSFMAMDLDYFDSLKKKNVLITEQAANPLYKILRHNGYKIGFAYDTSYFGDDGRKLDYYGVAKTDGICAHVEKKYALLGYCLPKVQHAVENVVHARNEAYPEMLFQHIKDVAKSGQPTFTYAHIYKPGHAKNSFNPNSKLDWDEERLKYAARAGEATQILHMLVTTIKENDPTAIFITFGDHGALTSRGLLSDEISINALVQGEGKLVPDSPLTFKQVVQDRHGVFMAVFPKTFCPEGFKQNPFTTVRVMREVVKCLSNGQDPLPSDFQSNDSKWIPYKYQ